MVDQKNTMNSMIEFIQAELNNLINETKKKHPKVKEVRAFRLRIMFLWGFLGSGSRDGIFGSLQKGLPRQKPTELSSG